MAKTGRPLTPVKLTAEERQHLELLARKRNAPAREVVRAKMILLAAQGCGNAEIARRTAVCAPTVSYWRRRFVQRGLLGLSELPRSGAPRRIADETVERVVRTTLESTPTGATHWSTRRLAARLGLSHQSIARIWHAFGLQPHRTEVFNLSRDPHFVAKVRDVVGLYLNPPDNALVLCVDEKSQIQALERAQPILPLRPGRPQRHSHDYFRHGTTSLFAALDVATGRVIGSIKPRHRSREFLAFLRQIERQMPAGFDVHLVADNYATHKTAAVARWLRARPHWHLHFTPTHASWLNQVERFFALITHQSIRRGSFRSVPELRETILAYINTHNVQPKPFRWTATADSILGKVAAICNELR
jgi:transposase